MEQVQENFQALRLLRSKASSHKPCEWGENPLEAFSAQDNLPHSMQGLSEGAVAAPGGQPENYQQQLVLYVGLLAMQMGKCTWNDTGRNRLLQVIQGSKVTVLV